MFTVCKFALHVKYNRPLTVNVYLVADTLINGTLTQKHILCVKMMTFLYFLSYPRYGALFAMSLEEAKMVFASFEFCFTLSFGTETVSCCLLPMDVKDGRGLKLEKRRANFFKFSFPACKNHQKILLVIAP